MRTEKEIYAAGAAVMWGGMPPWEELSPAGREIVTEAFTAGCAAMAITPEEYLAIILPKVGQLPAEELAELAQDSAEAAEGILGSAGEAAAIRMMTAINDTQQARRPRAGS
jgi:hypothetical protein